MWNELKDFAVANPAVLAAFASSALAFAAVIIAPLVAFRTARMQIRASLISANRQAWINALRDELAEVFELLERPHSYVIGDIFEQEAATRNRIRLLTNKITLRLNPLEADSLRLLELLEKLEIAAAQGVAQESDFKKLMGEAVAKAKAILKTEWNRVKKGR